MPTNRATDQIDHPTALPCLGANTRGSVPAGSASAIEHLLAPARRGDPVSLNELIARLYPMIGRFIAARLPAYSYDLREDLTQEAMSQIAAGLPSCRAATAQQLMGWATIVAWRAALAFIRQAPPGTCEHWSVASLPELRPPVPYAAHLADRVSVAVEETHNTSGLAPPLAQLVSITLGACHVLPRDVAVLIWFRVVVGASWREVGEGFRTTPAAAKRRFQRGVAVVRRLVKREIAQLPTGERDALMRYLR